MPRVSQAHLDARRQQIIDAARARFATHGFARTSMPDVVEASGLSTGAIYRYFKGKDEIIAAICEQNSQALPAELTAESIDDFLQHIRAMAREEDHARLVAQIYAEAAISPALAALVQRQLDELRDAVASLLPHHEQAESVAEAFVALCQGYNQQLAVRGDLDPAPFTTALMTIIQGGSNSSAELGSRYGTTSTGQCLALIRRALSDPATRWVRLVDAPTTIRSARFSSAVSMISRYGSPVRCTNVRGTPSAVARSAAVSFSCRKVSSSASQTEAAASAEVDVTLLGSLTDRPRSWAPSRRAMPNAYAAARMEVSVPSTATRISEGPSVANSCTSIISSFEA